MARRKKIKQNQPTFIDLFAGCGGLSLGLEEAGFYPLYVNELNADARETYLRNRDEKFPHLREKFYSGDIKKLISETKNIDSLIRELSTYFNKNFRTRGNSVDLVVGGAPCQGFSGIGYRRSYSVEKAQLPSNYLFEDMAFFIHKVRPKLFLFENVEGILKSRWTKEGQKGEIFMRILQTFKQIPNYVVNHKLVYSKDYGVPQNRPRVLLVGVRSDLASQVSNKEEDAVKANFLPMPTFSYPNLVDIFSDLVDSNFERRKKTPCYPSDAATEWQEKLRTETRNGRVRKKGEYVSEHEYSKHSEIVKERFSAMIKNDGEIPEHLKTKKFAQRLLPKQWGSKGPTITACCIPDDFVHYCQARTLTVREWARLQTFPDWYEFSGKRTTGGIRRAGNPQKSIFEREVPKYTQIGNAVPVKLAYEIGKHFSKLLANSY